MSYKHRLAAKVDDNQAEIVSQLRSLPGVSVEPGHDDILVGYRGITYWFEIKRPEELKKDGALKAGTLKDSQVKLLNEFAGHYAVVWDIDQILAELGIISDGTLTEIRSAGF